MDASYFKDRTVLVTGAAGCIGAWAVKLLREAGARPVVYDLSAQRDRLALIMPDAEQVVWELGDITDFNQLMMVARQYKVSAIIHLAALQVPFCKADPINSTRINVMGSINILELARQLGIAHLSYASSIAAPAMGDNAWLATLYGAHKICGEQMAAVYWQDWSQPSVGIRPGIIYGPGRDQGMSAAPTIAMLAAATGEQYTIPFSGDVAFVHVEDAAMRFIAAAAQCTEGARVFDMNGTPANVTRILSLLENHRPEVNLDSTGVPMPFPADPDDGSLDAWLKMPPYRSIESGVTDTLQVFHDAEARGFNLRSLLAKVR